MVDNESIAVTSRSTTPCSQGLPEGYPLTSTPIHQAHSSLSSIENSVMSPEGREFSSDYGLDNSSFLRSMEIDIPESIDYLQDEHQQSHTESGTQVQPTQRQTSDSAYMDNLRQAHVNENTTNFEESNRIEDTAQGFSCNVPVETYKLVFDNIDKTVKPRYMRLESQTKSLHYVQLYAVKDRVNLSHLSQVPPVVSDIDLSLILPNHD